MARRTLHRISRPNIWRQHINICGSETIFTTLSFAYPAFTSCRPSGINWSCSSRTDSASVVVRRYPFWLSPHACSPLFTIKFNVFCIRICVAVIRQTHRRGEYSKLRPSLPSQASPTFSAPEHSAPIVFYAPVALITTIFTTCPTCTNE